MLLRRRGQRGIIVILGLALISTVFSSAGASTYKIKQGDTLWTIAARHHTTVEKLTKANHLRENSVLALDRCIEIPGKAEVKPHPAKAKRPQHISAPARSTATVHARVDSVCLRSGTSTRAHRVTVLPSGTTMKLLARDGKWAKVALSNGTCGYIYRDLLASGPGTVSAATTYSSEKPAEEAAAGNTDRDDSSRLIDTALACRGARYVRGGTNLGGFDCSGFVRYVYQKYGISLPHSSRAQAGHGIAISRDELQPGDLVFFETHSRGISHVGIYIGNDRFVHAASRGRGVTVDSLSSAYYSPRYRGARRLQ